MKAPPMRSLPILPVLAGLIFIVPVGGHAAPPGDPSALVTALVSGLGRMMNDPALTTTDRELGFARIVEADCDLSRVARFALGNYSAAGSDADRTRFDQLFERWVTHRFARDLGRFDPASFSVKSVAQVPDGAIVSSEVANGNHPVEVDWHVSSSGDHYRIVDVAMEGISMALVEREEISDVLRRNGGTVAGLNRALEERLASDDAAASTSAVAAH